MEIIEEIAQRFDFDGEITSIQLYGNGHINRTYLVKTENNNYILQGINREVFKTAEDIIQNILLLWETCPKNNIILRMIPTKEGRYSIDADGSLWRAVPFAEGYASFDVIDAAWKAEKAARAFAIFGKTFANVDVKKLKETIPNFHNGLIRFKQLETAYQNANEERKEKANDWYKFAKAHKNIFERVQKNIDNGDISLRVTHNDTKVNNVLIHTQDLDEAKVIDLDTVMQGTLLYDFGDLVRTSVSPTKENEPDDSKIHIDKFLFEAICEGYSEMKDVMTPKEKEMIVDGAKYMIFIVGTRFLADYFNNDIYFKTSYPEENFIRARNQFVLLQRLEEIEPELRNIAHRYFK
jgi:N-acetylhexosamine kinase